MQAVRLQTEYMNNPIGIDLVTPRFFWNCEGGQTQTAYEVEAVSGTGELMWRSGKVESSRMTKVEYAGQPLKSRSRVFWRVRLWDENGTVGAWSDTAFFEMGLLKRHDWRAKWITGNYKVDKKRRYPADCFRRRFTCDKTVRKARLYITACGVYEAWINGKRAGDFILAPGITDYKRRIQYQTIDVTELLVNGENELTVWLADGWYRGSVGAWALKNQYGTETKILAQLEIGDTGGEKTVIASDESWEWSNDGPVRFADNKDGEAVNANRRPSYTGRAKLSAEGRENGGLANGVFPTASNNVAVKEMERFGPNKLVTPGGDTVLDFGQNFAGYVEFCIQAHEGDKIHLRFGEMLDETGEFTQKNIQCSNKKLTSPLQEVRYICKEGENHYKTRFAIFGFRYVWVKTKAVWNTEDFMGIAVYSAMERTGFFESSNPLLDRLVESTVWSAKSNSADLPTDCPTRERHGWSGDAQIFCRTASYLFCYAPFARKYVVDLYDWQKENGKLPQIVPEGGVDFYMKAMDGSVGWADAGIIIPYMLWKQYDDIRFVADFYGKMAKYAAFMQRRCGKIYPTAKPTGLCRQHNRYISNCGQAYGEWAEPADVHLTGFSDFARPHPEEATAYTCYVMELMAEISEALGKEKEAASYHVFAKGCRRAYQELVKKKGFSLDTDRQARLVRPLYFRLLDEKQTGYARKRLLAALEHYGWRVGTGFLSTPLILDVLTEIDLDAAYRLLENEEMPGWLYMAKNGATTIWEAWEGIHAPDGIASLNHYSKGAVCQWIFETMCGVRVAGENRFVIAPKPGGNFTYAQADYKSVYGTVSCRWEKDGDGYRYKICVPPNTTAEVCLPDERRKTLQSGEYEF